MIHGEEPLLIPAMGSMASQHNKRAFQIVPLLAMAGISVGVATGTAGLTSYNSYHWSVRPISINSWMCCWNLLEGLWGADCSNISPPSLAGRTVCPLPQHRLLVADPCLLTPTLYLSYFIYSEPSGPLFPFSTSSVQVPSMRTVSEDFMTSVVLCSALSLGCFPGILRSLETQFIWIIYFWKLLYQ